MANTNTLTAFTNVWKRLISTSLRYLPYVLILLFVLQVVDEYRTFAWEWRRWDLMFTSGLVAFIIALGLARLAPSKIDVTLDRLANRQSLIFDSTPLNSFKTLLASRASTFGIIGGVVVSLILFIASFLAFGSYITRKYPLVIILVILGYFAGYYLGHMVAYGTLGQLVNKEKVGVKTIPGHLDDAGGLKPIGDFYFYQAMVVAIPCIFLAVWWFIIPLFPWYSTWRQPYLGMLFIALILEILSFFLPMLVFHKEMQVQKKSFQKSADELSIQIEQLERELLVTTDADRRKGINERLTHLTEQYWEYEHLPTWPIDTKTRRRFTVNNALLFTPLLLEVINATEPVQKLADILIEILSSPSQ